MSLWFTLPLVVLAHIGFACHNVAAISVLGDIIDYGTWKFHQHRGATYIAVNNICFKFGVGVGAGISLGLAGVFGFDPASKVNSVQAIFGLQLAYIYLPLIFALVSVVFILAVPINRRRHDIIKRRLASVGG